MARWSITITRSRYWTRDVEVEADDEASAETTALKLVAEEDEQADDTGWDEEGSLDEDSVTEINEIEDDSDE